MDGGQLTLDEAHIHLLPPGALLVVIPGVEAEVEAAVGKGHPHQHHRNRLLGV